MCSAGHWPSRATANARCVRERAAEAKLTIPDLKVFLKNAKLPVGGKKADLLDRARAAAGASAGVGRGK